MSNSRFVKRLVSLGVSLSMLIAPVSVGAMDDGGDTPAGGVSSESSTQQQLLSNEQVQLLGQTIGSAMSQPQLGAGVMGNKATKTALSLAGVGAIAWIIWFFREIFSGVVKEIGSAVVRPFTEIILASGIFNPDAWTIGQYLTDLTKQAERGGGQDAVGRDKEIDALIDILSQEGKANACIVGEPGIGKTALVEGLAYRIAQGTVPEHFMNKKIIKVNMVSLIAGNAYSKPDGAITRMRALFDKAKKDPDIILFMDEFHQIAKCGFAELFKQYLDRPGVHVISATTTAEYTYISSDPALERRFKKLVLNELGADTTLDVLNDMREKYEKKFGVSVTDEALKAAVDLPSKYMRNRAFPDKSIDVLSLACTKVARSAKRPNKAASNSAEGVVFIPKVTAGDIRSVVMAETGIPLGPLTADEKALFNGLSERLNKNIIGQEHSVSVLCDAAQKGRSGFVSDSKPKSSFLLTGTHGVGKSALAECIGNEMGNLVKVDVAHSDIKDEFLEKVWKKPYATVVFDNIDRANGQTCDKILGILENGFTYDSRKRKVDFTNSIVLMTANVGENVLLSNDNLPSDILKNKISDCTEQMFGSNFINKLDDILVFNRLKDSSAAPILKIFAEKLSDQLKAKNITLTVDDEVIALMSKTTIDHRKGAYSLQKIVENQIEAPVSMMLVKNQLKKGDHVVCRLDGGKIIFEVSKDSKK